MKVPDLSVTADAGVHEWPGTPDAVKSAAAAAKLRFCAIDLQSIGSKSELMALAKGQLRAFRQQLGRSSYLETATGSKDRFMIVLRAPKRDRHITGWKRRRRS
jgi:hypothetical protein